MATTDVPFRTPMFDAKGAMSRTWILFFQSLGSSTSGATVAASTALYIVPVVAGVASPDASQGVNLLILNAGNTVADVNGNRYVTVAQPSNYSSVAGSFTPWLLVVQQDPVGVTGGYSVIFDSTYTVGFTVASSASPANTESTVDFKTISDGSTRPTSCLIDQPI